MLVIAGLISNHKSKTSQLYSFFELNNFIFHYNVTFKSTRYWSVNIINYNLDINNFISGIKISYLLIIFCSLVILSISLLILFPEKFGYITMRLTTFFDPSKGDSFQTDKALAAIKQGGLQGQGMGEGILKERVPEAHTDYIIAVITEEFGSIISILVITIFLYISFKIIKNCIKIKEEDLKISLYAVCPLY